MKTYVPELSEQRMIAKAPEHPVDFAADNDYINACVHGIAAAFGLDPFAGQPAKLIPARALIKQLIVWWRTLEPASAAQHEAFSRLPGSIRLLDTHSSWWRENTHKR